MTCCQKHDFVSDSSATLHFSVDTLNFDTIFSPLGSATFSCKIFNKSGKNLQIDEVRLAAGSASPFRMNVDGRAGYSVHNVKIAKKDSLFIFVDVKLLEYLLLTDAVEFIVNGVTLSSKLQIVAYGQNAVVISRDTVLRNSHTFDNTLPYIINANVAVDTGVTVTVDAGAKLYFGTQKQLTVNGSLQVNGTASNPCIFSFPRYKESWYKDAVGQWQGILINDVGSADMSFAQVRGAAQALAVMDTLNRASGAQLRLKNSTIEYAETGLLIRNGKVEVSNCLFANSEKGMLMEGGSAQFYSCTFVTPSSFNYGIHNAQVTLQNYHEHKANDNAPLLLPLTQAYFGNSIIYGSYGNEFITKSKEGTTMNYQLERCIVKVRSTDDPSFIGVSSENPKFKDESKDDFHLSESSPAINAGAASITQLYPIDLEGFNRTLLIPQDSSLGCYAYRP